MAGRKATKARRKKATAKGYKFLTKEYSLLNVMKPQSRYVNHVMHAYTIEYMIVTH